MNELKELLQAITAGTIPATNDQRSTAAAELDRISANERKAETERENCETCRRIADEVEAAAEGDLFICPHCGEGFSASEWDDTEHDATDEDGDEVTRMTCPHCGREIDPDDREEVTFYDYLADALDIEYIIDNSGAYKAARICIATGGPHIELDTERGAVMLYWWSDRAEYPLARDAVNALDEYAEENYNCMR